MTRRRLGIAVFVLLGMAAALAQQRIRSGIDVINFGVTVVDRRGTLVTGLTRDDFAVLENGQPQTIRYFLEGGQGDAAAPPLHLGLLFDTSGSMQDDIGFARTSIIKFLNATTAAVDITLVDFDTEIRVARYGPNDFPRLIERIRMRKPEGYTALYDALAVYLNGAADQDGEKVLVLYSDGGDTRSAIHYDELLNVLKAADVTLYAIGYLEHQPTTARLNQQQRMQEMASRTGGQALFPDSIRNLDDIYDRIHREISGRYHLGYVSADPRKDGAWRKVEIRLLRKDLRGVKIRTRSGYFAPLAPR